MERRRKKKKAYKSGLDAVLNIRIPMKYKQMLADRSPNISLLAREILIKALTEQVIEE